MHLVSVTKFGYFFFGIFDFCFHQDILRRAILEPGPPENFALKMVQEVIKPQVVAECSFYVNETYVSMWLVIT